MFLEYDVTISSSARSTFLSSDNEAAYQVPACSLVCIIWCLLMLHNKYLSRNEIYLEVSRSCYCFIIDTPGAISI